jgi:(p)ppGpp synthase/HD superfamily hydrolase
VPGLNEAIHLAVEAHRDQLDRAGQPYILHPLRVMLQLESEESRIAAVLHDVVEDSPITLDQLREQGFSATVVAAVDAVTRREREPYEESVARAGADPLGRQIKLADLRDNLNLCRILEPTVPDRERVERYRRAWRQLTGKDPPGS